MRAPTLSLACVLASCATTGVGDLADPPLRRLEAARFVRAAQEGFASRGLGSAPGRAVRIAGRRAVSAALCAGATPHCVALVTAAERARVGAFLPQRTTPDAIVSAPGVDSDRGAQVLVLDEDDLRYQPDARRASDAAPTVTEVEDRVRRQVIDWLAWLASTGALTAR